MPTPPRPAPAELRRDPLPLRGRTALVTGASRRAGIGHAVARRLAAYGASVYLHHHVPHDAAMPWGADDPDAVADSVREALGAPGARVVPGPGDLADPTEPARLVATAVKEFGRLDILVANHALSGSDGALDDIDAAMLDAHWRLDAASCTASSAVSRSRSSRAQRRSTSLSAPGRRSASSSFARVVRASAARAS
ncbi:3-ketoacyl-ACP reductase [Streptomyces canarius]